MKRMFTAVVFGLGLACGGVGSGPSDPDAGLVMPESMEEAEELCVAGDRAGCLFLSDLFDRDMQARKTHPQVFEKYVVAQCDKDVGMACYELGFIRLTGKAGKLDKKEAARVLQKGCDLGDGRACFTAGIQLRRGDGVGRNSLKALKMLESACEIVKDFSTCAEVGQMWTTQEPRGGPDMDKSKAYYDLACENQPTHPFCGS